MVLALMLLIDWSTLVERVGHAAPRGNVAELRALRDVLQGELQADESLRRYTHAYVLRSLAFSPKTSDDEQAELLALAIKELERAVELDPRNAEAHALLGSTYGASIGSFPERAAELGQKGRAALRKAMELQPHNPRVHYLHGSSAFYRPAEYGGGPAVAEPLLRRAVELFKNEPPQKPWPNWGRYETHVLLGQTLEKLGKRDAAREQYEQALAIVPESEYVRSMVKRTSR